MNRDRIPFLLSEAVISLYPAAADGAAVLDLALWSGSLANRLRMRMELDEMKIAGTGDLYATAHHIDEEHVIELDRTWILRKANMADDFRPGRNQQYVMEIVWQADGYWYKRTYFGVTGRVVNWESVGTNQLLTGQIFRAQRFTPSGGPGSPSVFTPIVPDVEQSIGFFREDPFIVGEYLMGHYRWPLAASLNSAKIIAQAGQGSDTILTLEIGGVLTAHTITMPAGVANTEVEVEVNLGGEQVAAGQTVRWKITSGPDAEAAAWIGALTMQVDPISGEEPTGFFHEKVLIVGDYLQGEYLWPDNVELLSAKVVAMAPQVAPVVMTLEIGGELTDNLLVIPVAAANTEVTTSLSLSNIPVATGQSVRWKVTGAPTPENSAWKVAVTMQVQR